MVKDQSNDDEGQRLHYHRCFQGRLSVVGGLGEPNTRADNDDADKGKGSRYDAIHQPLGSNGKYWWQVENAGDTCGLAVALASFFVSPDVVFCCLDLAQINPHSTEWECALARQRVFACYGLYAEERASFEKWRQQVPAVSWIYDEMVMSHVGSQFHHLQESMLEVLVYRQMHRRCPPANACFRASDPYKADIEEQMMRLLCVIHSTARPFSLPLSMLA